MVLQRGDSVDRYLIGNLLRVSARRKILPAQHILLLLQQNLLIVITWPAKNLLTQVNRFFFLCLGILLLRFEPAKCWYIEYFGKLVVTAKFCCRRIECAAATILPCVTAEIFFFSPSPPFLRVISWNIKAKSRACCRRQPRLISRLSLVIKLKFALARVSDNIN